MIRVLVADDHPLMRQGLRAMAESTDDLRVVGEADSGESVLELIGRVFADVLVMEVVMPGPGVFELMEEIRRRQPRLPVLILTAQAERQYGVRLIRLGARGYLTKNHSMEAVEAAVRAVGTGGRHITPELAGMLAAAVSGGSPESRHDLLSDREFQVFTALARGHSTSDIADDLELSPKTVSTYRSRVYRKMGMENLAQLVRYAMDHDLVL